MSYYNASLILAVYAASLVVEKFLIIAIIAQRQVPL
jgi:hypothetical protein